MNINHDQPIAAGTVVVMAKRPAPGRVKTRLTSELSPVQAAEVHAAMLESVLSRVQAYLPGRWVLALDDASDDDASNKDLQHADPSLSVQIPPGWEIIDQGRGGLGERLSYVWRKIGKGRAVFFGIDSPDTPAQALKSIWPALDRADAAVGPVDDGGYWCLAGRYFQPPLLTGIDWGSEAVYHQTREAAGKAHLRLLELPPWHDVDTPGDLHALQDRLGQADEPALTRLRQRLARITQDKTR
jgi:uncharacterized protein